MTRKDFILMVLCCACWAGNFTISAWAVGHEGVPPFMLATIRAAIVLVLVVPFFFLPKPEKFWRLMIVCLCVGPLHLAFLYSGLQTAPASGSAIVSQMLIPFASILSVIFLQERIGWVRSAAIAAAFMGVMVMVYEPGALGLNKGLMLIIGAYIALAIGSVMMKTVGDVDWRVYVAWVAALVFPTMGLCGLAFETGQAGAWADAKIPLLAAAGYAALLVSIFAHGNYFTLVKRYPISVVIPISLLVPVFAGVMGVVFLNETLHLRYLIGGAIILPCVYIIAKRGAIAPVQED